MDDDRFAEFRVEPHAKSKISRVIAVFSGKGGVGKSSVAALAAVELARRGLKVGIFDTDITGPSIPHFFGAREKIKVARDGMQPVQTESGIKLCSMNLLLENSAAPTVWRGPLIGKMLRQFWTDINWGQLDVLLLDLPPGTSDIPLSLFQMIRLDGLVLVTSPQSLVEMIVDKALKMVEMMDIPLLGVVENYAGFRCPHCGDVTPVFGPDHLLELCEREGLPLLAQLPIDSAIAEKLDRGEAEKADTHGLLPLIDRILAVPERKA